MKKLCSLGFLVLAHLLSPVHSLAQCFETTSTPVFEECPVRTHLFYVGPEIYHVHRKREGGSKQNGWIYGVRAGYASFKEWGFYWGIDGLYGRGILHGKSADDAKLRSHFIDNNVEGRLGFTLSFDRWCPVAITPYAGWGYFWEKNNFVHPSPLHLHNHTRFPYAVAGFLSEVCINPCWSAGLNFKLRYMYEGKCKVSNDPPYDDYSVEIRQRFHYRAELPLIYKPENWCHGMLTLLPFYELRQFGRQPNYPFDYLETTLNIWGVSLLFMYSL